MNLFFNYKDNEGFRSNQSKNLADLFLSGFTVTQLMFASFLCLLQIFHNARIHTHGRLK